MHHNYFTTETNRMLHRELPSSKITQLKKQLVVNKQLNNNKQFPEREREKLKTISD